MFSCGRRAGNKAGVIGGEPDSGEGVSVSRRGDVLADLDLTAELFANLADECLLWRFADLNLAAWKLPVAGERLSWSPLRDEDAIAGENGRPNDFNRLIHLGKR